MLFSDEKIEEILFREGLTLSSFTQRLSAFLIDLLFIFFLVWGFCYGFFGEYVKNIESKIIFIQKFLFLFFMFQFFYELFFILFFGATLGKMIVGIKVISVQTLDKPNFISILMRCFIKIVQEGVCCTLFIFALNDKFLRPFYDKWGRMLVISAG
ncbi:RDD family protein [Helicobacter sp. 13S00477-4]|uniref:RDD family protein n=1 Tax=Helicobacter sp. 13S00477-4 TaxID=1905759 RepID=UPI000BA74971|nr:RDD family protein [Helicobacter sp. 13S00477-4]PAF51559.1 hypothetical protein BKH44_05825 [Helicobacter sp. 13S00477-4]